MIDKTLYLAMDSLIAAFIYIFLIEAVIKIIAHRKDYFHDQWNRFDFTIVSLSVLLLLIN